MMATTTSTMLDAALMYAERGVPVFPVWGITGTRCACGDVACGNAGKHPLGRLVPHGCLDATTDPACIRAWWERYPSANIGARTGIWSVVLDVDPHHGGDDALAALERTHGELPMTPEVLTGGGGRHLHFEVVPGLAGSAGVVGPGLDIRATNNYVLLPPSAHLSGRTYADNIEAQLFETPLAPMPAWLVALASGTNGNGHGLVAVERPSFAMPETVRQGTRNDTLYRLARSLKHTGLSLGAVSSAVEAENLARCEPPLEADELVALLEHAWTQPDRQDFRPAASPTAELPWLAPDPVPTELPPVPPLEPSRLLPAAFVPWVEDIAERAQCPVDFVAVPAMVAVSAIVGRALTLRPKQRDDWTVVANLWGVVIGRPGIMKSPALHEALRPLHLLVAEAREAHRERMQAHAFTLEEVKAKRDVLKTQLKEAVKAGTSTDELRAAFDELEVDEPTERRYLVNDATVEKLGELLNENPNGLLLFRDELVGLLRTMDREGHENDRAFYCEAWNGTGGYTYDRIGRGTVRIEAACLSVLGGMQPGPLHAYLREAFGDGAADDGLIQRFQLAVYPDVSREWRNVDRWPDSEAHARVVEVFRELARLDTAGLGAHVEGDGLPFLRFTPEAQEAFDAWRTTLERRLRTALEHPVLVSHLAKYRSLVPALALLIHVVDCVARGNGGPVTLAATEQAIAWTGYLEAHARRLYHSITAGGLVAAASLADRIRSGAVATPFRVREIRRNQWTGLTGQDEVQDAVEWLVDLHWLRTEEVRAAGGGRPTVQYHVNPAVLGARQ